MPTNQPEEDPADPFVRDLTERPEAALELVSRLDLDTLFHLGSALAAEQRERAMAEGDRDAVLAHAFDYGFGRDGLGSQPWVEGPYIVCPGSLIAKNRANHKCRFISVNGSWVWESAELIHEEKRSSPGKVDGFRAIALLPVVEGTELDVVSGKMRSGQHQVEAVTSWEVRGGKLVEVSQRVVKSHGHGALGGGGSSFGRS